MRRQVMKTRKANQRNAPQLYDDSDEEEKDIDAQADADIESFEVSPGKNGVVSTGQRHHLDSSMLSPIDQSHIPHTAKNGSHLLSPSGLTNVPDAVKNLSSEMGGTTRNAKASTQAFTSAAPTSPKV